MNTQIERDAAVAKLREIVAPGSTIYVLLRRKNSVGTVRWLEFYHIRDGELKRITWDVARVLDGDYCRKFDALKVGGTGLDVGFASVYGLSRVLFGKAGELRHQWL